MFVLYLLKIIVCHYGDIGPILESWSCKHQVVEAMPFARRLPNTPVPGITAKGFLCENSGSVEKSGSPTRCGFFCAADIRRVLRAVIVVDQYIPFVHAWSRDDEFAGEQGRSDVGLRVKSVLRGRKVTQHRESPPSAYTSLYKRLRPRSGRSDWARHQITIPSDLDAGPGARVPKACSPSLNQRR